MDPLVGWTSKKRWATDPLAGQSLITHGSPGGPDIEKNDHGHHGEPVPNNLWILWWAGKRTKVGHGPLGGPVSNIPWIPWWAGNRKKKYAMEP